jgi:beta-glucosidase
MSTWINPKREMTSPEIPAFLDTFLPFEERLQDLLARMTLEEKLSLMQNDCRAIPRLGIPVYNYWNECLHGVAGNGRATVFPQAIGLAATWDPVLLGRVASAIGDEARAKYHAALRRQGHTTQMQGLTFWSPNINIYRDPRWGRGQETYGEDPFLTGEMGVAFVRGLQGEDPKYLRAAACAKHFAVHSGPEKDRHVFDARVSLRDLNDTYLPAFKRLVQDSRVEAVMGAYNRVNGEPACSSSFLLGEILRDKWQFHGHVVSDCEALTDIYAGHKFALDSVEAAALALRAGCDMSCGCTYDHLAEALETGMVSEADLDLSLGRTLGTRFRLGTFDPPEMVAYASTPESVIDCRPHRKLAHRAALESIVLLKNRNHFLPIRPDVRRILVVGPNATSIEALLGNYNGYNGMLSTILEGLAGRAPEGVRLTYRMGVPLDQAAVSQDWAAAEAASADVTIACLGLSPLLQGEQGDAILSAESGDRADIGLPQAQRIFLEELARGGARVVLVLCGGGPISLGGLDDLLEAVVFVWYPGQAGGAALAEVLFGVVPPSGKLPVTFPHSLDQLPPFDDYRMDRRTYRYSTEEPLYPFGFGLSYTRFEFRDLELSDERVAAGGPVSFSVRLANAGQMDADEVVQVYLSDLEASAPVPRHKLVAFRRVRLRAGRNKRLRFTLTSAMMSFVDESGEHTLEPGRFRLTVGSCSPGERGRVLGAPEPQIAYFELISN